LGSKAMEIAATLGPWNHIYQAFCEEKAVVWPIPISLQRSEASGFQIFCASNCPNGLTNLETWGSAHNFRLAILHFFSVPEDMLFIFGILTCQRSSYLQTTAKSYSGILYTIF
jgi:hypothetical protein